MKIQYCNVASVRAECSMQLVVAHERNNMMTKHRNPKFNPKSSDATRRTPFRLDRGYLVSMREAFQMPCGCTGFAAWMHQYLYRTLCAVRVLRTEHCPVPIGSHFQCSPADAIAFE